MARDKQKKNARKKAQEAPRSELAGFIEGVRENPLTYAVSVGFVLLCLAAGLIYRANANANEREAATELARAIGTEDAALQGAELGKIKGAKGELEAQVLFLAGEADCRAKEYDKAKAEFEQLRTDYPDSPYTPDAIEGLGFIAEQNKDYAGALAFYQEIRDKWGASFTARRQPYNTGRCQEQLGNLKDAFSAYSEQVALFPGSHVAEDAESAMARLRESHPDLFPATPEQPTAEAIPSAPSTEVPSLTPEAPPSAPGAEETTPAQPAPEGAQPSTPAEPTSEGASDSAPAKPSPETAPEKSSSAPKEPTP